MTTPDILPPGSVDPSLTGPSVSPDAMLLPEHNPGTGRRMRIGDAALRNQLQIAGENLELLRGDQAAYSDAGWDALDGQRTPATIYDPETDVLVKTKTGEFDVLGKWGTHVTRRAPFRSTAHEEHPNGFSHPMTNNPDVNPPRTDLQKMARARASQRAHDIRKHSIVVNTNLHLHDRIDEHHQHLLDRSNRGEFKQFVKNSRMTGREKRVLMGTARATWAREDKMDALQTKLERQADSTDIPGRFVKRKIARAERKFQKLHDEAFRREQAQREWGEQRAAEIDAEDPARARQYKREQERHEQREKGALWAAEIDAHARSQTIPEQQKWGAVRAAEIDRDLSVERAAQRRRHKQYSINRERAIADEPRRQQEQAAEEQAYRDQAADRAAEIEEAEQARRRAEALKLFQQQQLGEEWAAEIEAAKDDDSDE